MKSWLMLGSINIAMAVITGAYLGIAPVGVATFFLGWPFLAWNLLTG
jgi:hypothetical protein